MKTEFSCNRPFGSALAICCCAIGLCLSTVWADPELSFDGMLANRYLDRGALVIDAAVFQAELGVALNGFEFGVRGVFDLTGERDRAGDFFKTELSLAYGFDLDPMDLLVGVSQAAELEQPWEREVFLHAVMRLPLNPAVGIYYDFDLIEGVYLDIGAHHDVRISDSVSIELRTALGYGDAAFNRDAFGYAHEALRDFTAGAAMMYQPDHRSLISVGGTFWRLVDQDLRAWVDRSGDETEGFVLTASFQRRF